VTPAAEVTLLQHRTEPTGGAPTKLPVSALQPSPRNPRRRLDSVDELADSIREYGLLQPIVVRSTDDGYQVVAGHRRLEAVRSLGWETVPAVVQAADDSRAYLLSLIENLQREDLTPRDESSALEELVREHGWSTRQVAAAVKRSQAYVSKRLRVFEDRVLAPLVLENRLSVTVAEELLPAPPERREALAEQAADEQWDLATARAAVRGGSPQREARDIARGRSLLRQLRDLRATLNGVRYWELQDSHRNEMRRLFLELAVFAKAPKEKREIVFPALPQLRARRQR
jgi:ParB family transcriptional regulator, chromosome partitioning protein